MNRMPHARFEFGWYSWSLGEYRPCHSTYCLFPYDTLPPLSDPDRTFNWLMPDGETADRKPAVDTYAAELCHKVDQLAGEAARLGVRLPEAFVRFMSSPELVASINSGTGCWFRLADKLIPCPGFDGSYLVGFLRDQQDCIIWSLCLTQVGEHCVLALPDDFMRVLPEYSSLALLGDLELVEDAEELASLAEAAAASEELGTQADIASAILGIRVCAPSFESFIYRFWLEDNLAWKLTGKNKAPLTDEERRYLDHYARQRQTDA